MFKIENLEQMVLHFRNWCYWSILQYKWEDVAGSHDICLTDYTEAEEYVVQILLATL